MGISLLLEFWPIKFTKTPEYFFYLTGFSGPWSFDPTPAPWWAKTPLKSSLLKNKCQVF